MEKDVLAGLKLFEKDFRLRLQITSMIEQWKRMCPSVDYENQVAWAHYWLHGEVLKNKNNMKKDLIGFLNRWMKSEEKRNQERRQSDRRAPSLPPPVRYDVPDEEILSGEDFKRMREAIRKK